MLVNQELVTINSNADDDGKLEMALTGWLMAKAGRSGSRKTKTAYQETIGAFRTALQAAGYDLDSAVGIVALAAQGWAAQSFDDSKLQKSEAATDNMQKQAQTDVPQVSVVTAHSRMSNNSKHKELSPATYNQRLAILSSFYSYAARQGLLPTENPISRVERRPVQSYASAHAQEYAEIKAKLKAIDRSTLDGKRDYALLSVAIQTGRRISELAALTRTDMRLQSENGKVTLTFQRTKGGKTISDTLPVAPSRALIDWLAAYYKAGQVGQLPKDAPLWVSLSRRNGGEQLTIQTLADICERRLGTSKFHSLRHTFAKAMEDSGAKVSDIQARLGHTSLATTGRYLAALHRDENAQADALAQLFGLE